MKLVVCIPNSLEHYTECGISFLGIYDINTGVIENFAIDLVDSNKTPLPTINDDCIVLNKRLFDKYYPDFNSYDLETQYWIHNEIFDESLFNFKKFYYFYRRVDFFKYVPFVKYCDAFTSLVEVLQDKTDILHIDSTSEFYKNYVYKNIEYIEKNGLFINLEKFNNKFSKNYVTDIVKTFYNLHTTTGRPSNTYDGINYSALNKKDGFRECFESRFEDGYLIEFDFDSYHLRIIGKMIGYKFEDNISIHTEFAKKFYNKDVITEQDYENSKKLSFTMLYKDSDDLVDKYNIDFFNRVREFKLNLWQKANNDKYVESKISKRKLKITTDFNPSKVFNYYLQMIETEFSMLFIYDVSQLLKSKLSKIVLYTYDSILIDFNPKDGLDLIDDIRNKLLTTKISKGKNYNEMRRVG